MSAQIETLKESELPQIASLIARVFNRPMAADAAERLSWLLYENPDAGADIPAGWTLRKDGRIIGFIANVVRRMAAAQREWRAACTAHFVVEPEHRFHGLMLAKVFFDQKNVDCLFCSTANESSGKVLQRFGMMPVAGGEAAAVFVLHAGPVVAEVMRRRGHGALLSKAAAVGAGGTVGLVERVRHHWPKVSVGVRIEKLDRFDERVDELWQRARGEGRVQSVRDARRLNWLFRDGPATRPHTQIHAVTRHGRIDGYLVTMDPTRMAMRRREVMDVFVIAGDEEGFASLVGDAARTAREDGMDTLEFRNLPGGLMSKVVEWGARSRQLEVNPFMVKWVSPELQIQVDRADSWYLVPSDGDGVGW